ncbi:MAG: HAD family hydrolase [Acaryochloris sp. RU_4_1]|nr:HAD family hydrolase [Acaryochloris sp. RU_4_1]NJR53360.1 HAD family hydrolase [Acaryochloris sp. CRU_2_0]
MATICCLDRTFTDIKAIIFDKDGTLADVESYLKSLGQKRSRLVDAQVPGVQEPLLLAFGLEETSLNPAGLLAVGSRRENEIAAAAYVAETGRNWLEALEIVESAFKEADSYLKRKADHTPLFPDTLATLATLTQNQVKIGLLSADSPENIQAFVETYDLDSHIHAYLGVEGTLSKPDPSLFMDMCTQLETLPQQTLMVGDSAVDMKMAQSAGAAAGIMVTWGWSSPVQTPSGTDVTLGKWQQLTFVSP